MPKHILAISGLHIGIISFVLNLFFKALRARSRVRYAIIIFLLIFYCILSGARPPVMRATIMAIIVLTGFFLKKDVRIFNSLSLACLAILAINPYQLFDVGFQLSFLSVASIVWFTPRFKKHRIILKIFSVSFTVWIGLLPLTIYYFKLIHPVAIIANIIVVPYLSLVISLGLALLIISGIFPVLAPAFSQTANFSVILLIQIIQFFNKIPFAYFYL